MGQITAYEAEKKYKISRMTVGRWIKAGRIAADIDNMVDESALVAILQSKHPHPIAVEEPKTSRARHTPSGSKQSKAPIDPDIVGAPGGFRPSLDAPVGARSEVTAGDHMRPDADITIAHKKVKYGIDILKRESLKLDLQTQAGQLVPYNLLGQAAAKFNASLEEQFRMFAEREGDELAAEMGIEDNDKKISLKRSLSHKIDHSIRSVLAASQRMISDCTTKQATKQEAGN